MMEFESVRATMPLLQALLSILLSLGFLTALIAALLLILKLLQSIRGYLEKIAFGVRAIEHQLGPLGDHVTAAGPGLEATTDALERATTELAETERRLVERQRPSTSS